ncbi:MAG: hypothetical protein KAS71_00100, partial [Bacteroidales bacterium]|nr:hypothetical protein [Bacteroidales bacterium]
MGTDVTLTSALLDGITGSGSWDQISPNLTIADVGRTDNIVTITIPLADATDYFIGANETVSITIPDGSFANTIGYDVTPVDPSFQINNEGPTVAVTGSMTATPGEEDIRAGSETIILTLTGDKWHDDVATSTLIADPLFAGISGTEWDLEVNLGTGNIERNTDFQVTITLPATSLYDIYANETVSISVDADAVQTTTTNIAASSLTIKHDSLIVDIGGTILGSTESAVRAGGKDITLTLTNDVWDTNIGVDETLTNELLGKITGDRSWDQIILDIDNVVRTTANIVSITIPLDDATEYFLSANETVSIADIPASLFTNTAYAITPVLTSFEIINEGITLAVSGSMTTGADETEQDIRNGDSTIILTLTGERWLDDIATDSANAALLFNAIIGGSEWNEVIETLRTTDITRDYDTIVTIILPPVASYDINEEEVISVNVPHSVLKHSTSDTISGSQTFSVSPLGAAVSVSGTIFDGSLDGESDINPGGPTIILQLTEGLWETNLGTGSNTSTSALISSFSGDRDWSTVTSALDFNHINRDDDYNVTITLPSSGYNIYDNETVSTNINSDAVQFIDYDLPGSSMTIQHDTLRAVLEGSILSSKDEFDIRAGGDTLIVKLRNDTWVTAIGTDNPVTVDFLNGITGDQNWNLIPLDYNNVLRSNDSTVMVIIPEASDYYIGGNETVSINILANASANTIYPVASDPETFIISEESVSFTITGDVTTGDTETETDIIAGGNTVVITVIGDQWESAIDSDFALANLLFSEITGSASWNSSVTGYSLSNISLDNETTVSITLPSAASYSIDNEDFININVVADLLNTTTTGTFAVNNAFSVLPLVASVNTSGNIVTGDFNKEDDIRTGGGEIIFTLIEDEWAPTIGSDDILTANLINSISGGTDWETLVKPAILGTDRGASSVNVVGQDLTITLPPVVNYNILENDTLRTDILLSCLVYMSSGTVIPDPDIVILPAISEMFLNDPGLDELTLNGSVVTISLKDETFVDAILDISNFSTNKPSLITVDTVTYISSKSVNVILSHISDFDAHINDFNLTVDASELTAGEALASNNISILSRLEPEITDVTIAKDTFEIGDVISVLITVVDDLEAVYTYSEGTIGDRDLDSLKRISNTSYLGYITVDEDGGDFFVSDDIPVSGLQLNNLPLIGEFFSSQISDSIVIDATRPVINYMQISGNSMNVGDQIEIIVSTDSDSIDYNVISPTSVNFESIDSAGISVESLSNGIYLLKYTVSESDNDVAVGALTVQFTLLDFAGNESYTYTTLPDNSVSVDANTPLIDLISVTDSIYSHNDVVEIIVRTDGDDYSFDVETEVNGIPFSSPFLTGSHTGSGEYTLFYTVNPSDVEVEVGMLEVTVQMFDVAGNQSDIYNTVEPNNLAVYTILPEATIAGNQEMCINDSALLLVNFTGRVPLKFYISDGVTTTLHDNILVSPYEFYVSPIITSNIRVDSVFDVNGIKNVGSGLVKVIVNPRTDVKIIDLNYKHSVEDEPVLLEANFMGGTFSGPGVISSTGYFSPEIADTIESPHTLYYDYINSYSCSSIDSIEILVLAAKGEIIIDQPIYCDYVDPFFISATNTEDKIGEFRLLSTGVDPQPVAGLVDNFDNTASISPVTLNEGEFTVEYKYDVGGAFLTLRENFTIENITVPNINTLPIVNDLPQNEYCENFLP